MPSKRNSSGDQFDAQLQIRHSRYGVMVFDFEGLEYDYDEASKTHIVKRVDDRGQYSAGMGDTLPKAVAELMSFLIE